MPSSDWKVEIVDANGDPDYSVSIVGDIVVDLTGATDGQVLTVQPDGTVAAENASSGGPAGGVLSGTYPNPGFAVDMATQAELDAKVTDAIADGATTIAPSQNAVFDALALKAPIASPVFTGTVRLPSAVLSALTPASAVTAGAGAVIWCSDLALELVSDGANWLAPRRFGFAYNVDPELPRSSDKSGVAANQGRYWTVQEGGVVSSIGFEVDTQSGNMCLAVYRQSGLGRNNVPGTRLATTGSIAVPAPGYQEASLGATVVLYPGDWIGLAADNATAQFRAILSAGGATNLGKGRHAVQASAFPLPSPPSSLSVAYGTSIVLLGV